jgi:PAS domain S-box-containing protein/putative nucleotidyltransferase with HDIG domain
LNYFPQVNEPHSLYELSWAYAPECMFAMDANTGVIVDVNPAAEALMGYSRDELIGMHQSQLHPEAEREHSKSEFRRAAEQPSPHSGFHLLRKDSQTVPVMAWSSKSIELEGRLVLIVVCRDITDLEQREHQLATKSWALSAYAAAAMALWQKHSHQSLLGGICEAITRESVYLLAWVGIAEDGPGKPIRTAAAAGSAAGYLDGLRLSWSESEEWGRGPTGVCVRTGRLQMVEDTESAEIFRPWAERARKFGIRSSVSISFSSNGGARGVLVVYAGRPSAFEPVAIDVFVHLAEQIGHSLHAIEQEQLLEAERKHTARAEEQLTKALSGMVMPIVMAMEMRDPYTVGHQGRVAEIAVAIGREMGWTAARLEGLRVAAQVHDIGKISIPAEILTKPGKLNDAERGMINAHAEIGYTILKDIPFPWPIAEMVRQHHEKLDGSGYPRGLKADQILPEAKVLAVADIVEAMASYRPYRAGIKLHLVLRQIEKDAGVLLDPEAVRICVSLFREKHFMLPGWIRR